MKSFFFSTLLCFISLTCSNSASLQAGTITVNQTLDISRPLAISSFLGWQGPPAFSGGVNETLAVGDTLDYTIDFLNDQSLTMTNLSLVWAFIYADTPSQVTGTGSLSFLDSTGSAFLTSLAKTDTEGDVHFGQFFESGDFLGGLPSTITFYGVRYVGTIEAYVPSDPLNPPNPAITERNYSEPAFYMSADQLTTNIGAVPEPSSFVVFGMGIVGLAMMRNKRKPRLRSPSV